MSSILDEMFKNWYPVNIGALHYFDKVNIYQWCEEKFPAEGHDDLRVYNISDKLYFKSDQDRTWFILHWGELLKS